MYLAPIPFGLEIGATISSALLCEQGEDSPFIRDFLPLLRHEIYYETGVSLPAIAVRGRTEDFDPDKFVISIREVPVFEGRIQENICDVAEYLILMLSGVARRHLTGFLTLATVYKMVDELRREHPQFVKDVVDYRVSLVKLADAFKILVGRGHSIRDLETIFEVLARHAHPEMSEKELATLLEKGLVKRREKLVLNAVPEMNDALFTPQPVVVVLTGKVAGV